MTEVIVTLNAADERIVESSLRDPAASYAHKLGLRHEQLIKQEDDWKLLNPESSLTGRSGCVKSRAVK